MKDKGEGRELSEEVDLQDPINTGESVVIYLSQDLIKYLSTDLREEVLKMSSSFQVFDRKVNIYPFGRERSR